jgi:hypothetical protein
MHNGYEPKILICVECGEEFVFTSAAQQYFAEKGYTEVPKRCKHCYMHYKRNRKNGLPDINGATHIDQESMGSVASDNP